MKSVSIVIPNWNGAELLAEYLDSVLAAAAEYRASTQAPVEVIVVDDASTDQSREWLRENFEGRELTRLVELRENVGFLRAVNEGFRIAGHDVVFLLNNDVMVERDCIGPLVKDFDDQKVFAVCCRASRNDGRLDGGGKIGRFERGFWRVFLNYEAIPDQAAEPLVSFYGSGGYTAYAADKWYELGGFQDCLAPIYWEDVEICYRAWKRGWTVLYEPESRVVHKGSATMGKRSMRKEMAVVTERNRLLMTWINLHDRRLFTTHAARLAVKLAGSLITFRWNYLRSFGRAVAKISKVLEARRIERKAAVISDSELAQKFLEVVDRPGVYVVENEQAEIDFAEMKSKLTAVS